MKICFCVIVMPAFCVAEGKDLATWDCEATEAGVEDRTCMEDWAAACGKAGIGADICDCVGTDDGVAADTCVWATACGGADTGAVAGVCRGTEAGAKLGICVGPATCVGAGRGAVICVWAKAEGVVWTCARALA